MGIACDFSQQFLPLAIDQSTVWAHVMPWWKWRQSRAFVLEYAREHLKLVGRLRQADLDRQLGGDFRLEEVLDVRRRESGLPLQGRPLFPRQGEVWQRLLVPQGKQQLMPRQPHARRDPRGVRRLRQQLRRRAPT